MALPPPIPRSVWPSVYADSSFFYKPQLNPADLKRCEQACNLQYVICTSDGCQSIILNSLLTNISASSSCYDYGYDKGDAVHLLSRVR